MFNPIDWPATLDAPRSILRERPCVFWRPFKHIYILLYRWCTKCLCMYIYVVTRYSLWYISRSLLSSTCSEPLFNCQVSTTLITIYFVCQDQFFSNFICTLNKTPFSYSIAPFTHSKILTLKGTTLDLVNFNSIATFFNTKFPFHNQMYFHRRKHFLRIFHTYQNLLFFLHWIFKTMLHVV